MVTPSTEHARPFLVARNHTFFDCGRLASGRIQTATPRVEYRPTSQLPNRSPARNLDIANSIAESTKNLDSIQRMP